jgi:hypothetical protein
MSSKRIRGLNISQYRIHWKKCGHGEDLLDPRNLVCLILHLFFSAAQSVYCLSLSCCIAEHTVCYWACPSLLHSQCTVCLCPANNNAAVQNTPFATVPDPVCCTVSVLSVSVLHIVLHHDFPMIHCTNTSLCMGRSALGHALNATTCNKHLS